MATYHRDVVKCFIRDLPPTSENRKALIQRRHDVLLPSGSDLNAVSQGGNKKKKKKKKKKKEKKKKKKKKKKEIEKRKTKKARFKLFSC